jgi:hypothetical protein
MSRRCKGETSQGSQCSRTVQDPQFYCWQHAKPPAPESQSSHGHVRSDTGPPRLKRPISSRLRVQHSCSNHTIMAGLSLHEAAEGPSFTNALRGVGAPDARSNNQHLELHHINCGFVDRDVYLRMSPQDRFQISTCTVINMLKRYKLLHNDLDDVLSQIDRIIAYRRMRSRLDAFFHRPLGEYIDISGNRYYNTQKSKKKALEYGQIYYHPYNQCWRILGERDLDLERKNYDPVFQTTVLIKLEAQICDIKEYVNHKEKILDCYKMDLVTFCDLNDLEDPEMIYMDVTGRAYYLPSILGRWEAGFSIYDKEAARIVPQYPLDFNNEAMEPQLARNIYATYQDRIRDQTRKDSLQYPLVRLLFGYDNLLEELYQFIIGYRQIRKHYDQLGNLYPEDEGLANRRDIMAIQALKELYVRQNLPNFGYRKYATYTSTNGANGTQIFYQHVLSGLFWKLGYRPVIDTQDDDGLPVNLRWEHLPGQPSAVLVSNSIIPICRPGHLYLVAFK